MNYMFRFIAVKLFSELCTDVPYIITAKCTLGFLRVKLIFIFYDSFVKVFHQTHTRNFSQILLSILWFLNTDRFFGWWL